MLTPLALVLVVVDVMDLIFAVDSIPAIFAVTRDPFIVYTSNICAILGLRSLYFLLAGAAGKFKYLHYGLAGVLTFIGVKMLLAGVFPIRRRYRCWWCWRCWGCRWSGRWRRRRRHRSYKSHGVYRTYKARTLLRVARLVVGIQPIEEAWSSPGRARAWRFAQRTTRGARDCCRG